MNHACGESGRQGPSRRACRGMLPWVTWLVFVLLSESAMALKVGELEFQRCELPAGTSGDTISAYCTTRAVPLSHADADKGSLDLHIAYFPARDPEAEKTPVVFLAGGPGQAASETYQSVAGPLYRINERFPVVFFDQRGTGRSSALACDFGDVGNELEFDPADAGRLGELLKQCLLEFKHDPRYFTTDAAVADLEWMRASMGFSQLNLYGVSYGTRLAQRYVRAHPGQVRSVILDGVVPPDLVLGQSFGATLDGALAKLDAACAADAGCAELGSLRERLTRLKARYASAPETVRFNHPRSGITQTELLNEASLGLLVRLYAYSPETYALLPQILAQAEAGNPAPLLAQAVLVGERMRESIGVALQLSVICSEDAPKFSSELSDEQASFLGSGIASQMASMCVSWPRLPVAAGFHERIQSAIPALFLSGEFDPVTPPDFAERAIQGWSNARHLIAKGQGHHVLPRGCMARLADAFLSDLNPALDSTCLETLSPAPFFTNNNGAAP